MHPPVLSYVDFDAFNEADVRAEIIEPLLRALGYGGNTEHPIQREREIEIRYKYSQLGRRKPGKDPVLRGKFDYLCEVRTFGSWILEAKSPLEPVSSKDIEQTHSYAVHPEIRACMFAVCNGREFLLFETNAGPSGEPVLHLSYEQLLGKRFFALYNAVSPDAIKRRRQIRAIDLAKPLASGFGPAVRIVGGYSCYEKIDLHLERWPAGIPKPNTEGALDVLTQFRFPITGDRCWRADTGEIVANVRFARFHDTHAEIAKKLGIEVQEYICRDEVMSFDPDNPNIFQTRFKSLLPAGTSAFDMAKQQTYVTLAPIPIGMYTEVIGYTSQSKFFGIYAARVLQEMKTPVGEIRMWTYLRGHCNVEFEAT
jgi:hypothetical protein